MKSLRLLSTFAMLVILAVSIAIPMARASSPPTPTPSSVVSLHKPFVSPVVLKPSYYEHRGLVPKGSIVEKLMQLKIPVKPVKVIELRKGQARVLIIADPRIEKSIAKHTHGIVSEVNLGSVAIIVAWVTKSDVEKLSKMSGVLAILPDVALTWSKLTPPEFKKGLLAKKGEARKLLEMMKEHKAKPLAQKPWGTATIRFPSITGAEKVWSMGIMGQGVRIGIIDTGIDYASPALGMSKIAWSSDGRPLILDDEMGLVLTLITVHPNASGYINVKTPVSVYNPLGAIYWVNHGFAEACVLGKCNYTVYPITTWYVGHIESKLPMKFGLGMEVVVLPDLGGYVVFTYPVLLVSKSGTAYDTVYVDLNTTYYYVAYVLNATGLPIDIPKAPAFSFASSQPHTYRNPIIGLDLDHDGLYDFSVGTIAGYVYDALGIIKHLKTGHNVTPSYVWTTYDYIGFIYPGIDPSGLYVDIFYDFYGHGTACAATAAGNLNAIYALVGTVNYEITKLPGEAPLAKIVGANALWMGDTEAALLWMAGFNIVGYSGVPGGPGEWYWVYSGKPRAEIVSHSYGISIWPFTGWASGYDPWSQLFDYVTLKTGVINVVAGGNGGYGWGTTVIPGASVTAITTAASTYYGWRWLYGFLPGGYDEIATWSNRGPTAAGLPKPDVAAIGSFAFVGARTWDSLANVGMFSSYFAYTLFGGTSQATPMTAGAVALLIQAYGKVYRARPAPWFIKAVLKSTADDLGYGPLAQGSGRIDVYKAVEEILYRKYTIAFSPSVYLYYRTHMNNLMFFQNFRLPPFAGDTALFFGDLIPPASMTTPLMIIGRGEYKIEPVTLVKVVDTSLCNYIDWSVKSVRPAILGCENGYLLLNLSNFMGSNIIPLKKSILSLGDLLVIRIVIPFQYFSPGANQGIYGTALEFFTELGLGSDINKDGVIEPSETARMSIDFRYMNTQRVTCGYPEKKFEELAAKLGLSNWMPTLRLYAWYNYWFNKSGYVVKVRAEVIAYKFEPWSMIKVPTKVYSYGARIIPVTAVVTYGTPPGLYVGYVKIVRVSDGDTVLVPTVISVATKLGFLKPIVLTPSLYAKYSNLQYNNIYLRNANDWGWRFESGDWRVFKVVVPPNTMAKALVISVRDLGVPQWANLEVYVFGPLKVSEVLPTGYIVRSYTIHGVLLGMQAAYRDTYVYSAYLTPGVAQVIVPITGPGTYTILIRSTNLYQYNGDEPIEVGIYPVNLAPPMLFAIKGIRLGIPATVTTYYPLGSMTIVGLSDVAILNGVKVVNPAEIGLEITPVPSKLGFYKTSLGYYIARTRLFMTYSGKVAGRLTAWLMVTTPVPNILYGELWAGSLAIYYSNYVVPLQVSIYVR